ncbi:MAG: type II toxin-antitoxin system Phd/YefM family antitoxin [Deltaproteobacteria bacterium]|nr:type II toxin-antitoxin system Phd/YefM family antitoxin [Deltaproteobacteria bacterium]
MAVNATELRRNLYRLLDHVLESGEPLEIERRGHRLRLVLATPEARKLDRLVPHPDALTGDADEIVQMDWSGQWHP